MLKIDLFEPSDASEASFSHNRDMSDCCHLYVCALRREGTGHFIFEEWEEFFFFF